MVASQAEIQQESDESASAITASMEAHAASGNWERVEEIAAKLRIAIMQVPEHERRDVILAARRSMDKVQTLAQNARNDVTGKLSAIRLGKDATAAYTGTD